MPVKKDSKQIFDLIWTLDEHCVLAKMSKSLENNTSYYQSSFWNTSTWENLRNWKTREREEGNELKLVKDMKERRHNIDRILKGIFVCFIKLKAPILKANILLFMINLVEIWEQWKM